MCTYAGMSMCEGGSGFIRAHRRATDLNKSFSRDNPRRVCHFISCNFVLDAPRNAMYMCTCVCVRACVVVRIPAHPAKGASPSGPPTPVTAMHRDRADHLFTNCEEIYTSIS